MDNLQKWLEPVLEENGCTLYEIEWETNVNPPILRISIDKVGGVDLDTCAQCSDAISVLLDEKDWYGKEYMLEVCSPGAEKELKTDEQIQNAVGSYVFVKLKDPKQGVDSVRGDLLEANETSVTISYRDKSRTKTIVVDKSNISLIMTAVKL
ncbi:MAG: ribosome maturation factor RimP [Holdemanella sp.]|nr:ribosome maturation factor RimP [Holdemanella sp.]